jgi:hypothetical protein
MPDDDTASQTIRLAETVRCIPPLSHAAIDLTWASSQIRECGLVVWQGGSVIFLGL